jgi:hypothetical protein
MSAMHSEQRPAALHRESFDLLHFSISSFSAYNARGKAAPIALQRQSRSTAEFIFHLQCVPNT